MKHQEQHLFINQLSNLQLNMSVAAYTTVPQSWRELNFTPDFNRFYYIMDGEGCIEIEGEEFYPLPGQLVLLPSGIVQSYSTISEFTYTKYWCHFTATVGDVNLFHMLKLSRVIDVDDSLKLSQLMQDLVKYHTSQEITALLRVKSILLELICYFIEHSQSKLVHFCGSVSLEKVNALLEYIEQHIHQNITVNELAKLVHFHPNYFIHFFHKMTGYSPVQYINKQKMERAKHMLSTTDLSVTEISERVGFQLYYFSKIFKKATGFSPTAYRGFSNP